ncbi:hypothetical protein [Halobacterium wangiae]|uniref:hypothetical protein n=1 Tax=Halobacterium wangiae TaxID=2902623 RepID=UPI001E60E91A|nr:hypothetical protein [Halobacterium wangiae]
MRATVLLVAVLVVVGAGAPLAAGSPAESSAASTTATTFDVQEDDNNESENETAPGARLAGVVNVQGAEVAGEVAERSFGLRVAAAKSNASKASVVAEESEALETRLAELRERKQDLLDARQDGDISQSRFRGEMAQLATEISTVERLSNRTAETARGLPADALASKNVDTAALGRLQEDAGKLTGPEMAAIARDIAGPPANRSTGRPGNGGGPSTGTPGAGNGPTADGPATNTTDDNTTVTTGNASDGLGDGPAVTPPGNGTGVPGNGTGSPGNGPLDGTYLDSLAESYFVTL